MTDDQTAQQNAWNESGIRCAPPGSLNSARSMKINRHIKLALTTAIAIAVFLAIISALSLNGTLPSIPEGLSEKEAREVLMTVEDRMRNDLWKRLVRFDFKGAGQAIYDLVRYQPVSMQVIPIPGDPNPLQVAVNLGLYGNSTNGIGYAVRRVDGRWTTGNSVQGRWVETLAPGLD